MERFFIKRAKQLLKKKEHRKKQQIFVTCLAVFVITGTAYAMIKPAITMQKSNQELDCPYESGTVAHEHNKYCYDNDGELICQLEEIEPHTHTEDCYTQKEVLICDIEESEGHIHTDDCYERERGALLCADEEHEHTDECYEWNNVLICDKEETEGHIHTDDCYKTVSILECGKEELPIHEHNKDCFVTVNDEENIDNEADNETDEETATIGQEYDEELYDEALYDEYLEDDYGIELMSGADIQNDLVTSAANDWQIVSGGYEGNDVSNKTASDDESVMLQKNVIPTDTENEFLVYLSIDTKDMFTEYFKHANYQATESNNNHSGTLGSLVSSMGGTGSITVSGDSSVTNKNSGNFTIEASDGSVIAENVTIYWSKANNVTFYLKISDNQYVLMGLSVKAGGNTTVRLSAAAEEAIRKAVSDFSLVSVKDEMGDNIEFLGVVGGDYDSEPTFSNNILTWEPKTNDSATVDESVSGGYTTRWYRNVSQLLYKVRLKTEADGFNSCAVNLDDDNSNDRDFSYEVNNYARLTYDKDKTVDFPIPAVQGLLYDVNIKKVDSGDGTVLEGAEFEVDRASSSGNSASYSTSGTTDANGMLTLTVPFGSYTLTETKPPSGYMDNEYSSRFTVCYTDTDNKNNLEINGSNMLYTGDGNNYITIENDKIPNLDLIKVNDSGTPLGGAEFELYKADENWNEGDYVGTATSNDGLGSLGKFSFEGLELGNYLLYETIAPNGYYKADEPWRIVVAKSGITITDYNGAPVSSTDADGNIEIVNSSGAVLPSTGGNGTGLYAVVGLTLMAISLYIYTEKNICQRRENLTNGIHK